jgi:tetratricopeptide (TPR) repeat protein
VLPSAAAIELLSAGKLDEAEALLQPLLSAHPLDPDLLANLGLIAFRRRNLAHARELLQRATAISPHNHVVHSNLAAVLADLGEFAAAELHARSALSLDPTDTEAQITLAECLTSRESFDEAERSYAEAAQVERWRVAGQVRFGRTFFEVARVAFANAQLPPVTTIASSAARETTHVLFLACSADYLERYAGSLLESLSANGGGDGLLHLHLVSGDEGITERLAAVPKRYSRLPMIITMESPDLAGMDQDRRVAFHTAARFLRVPTLLAHYAKPVVTLDIDAIIEGPTRQLVEAGVGADLALMLRIPQRIAWTNVLAGTVVFNPSARAMDFARQVAGFLLASMAEGRMSWNIDQIALYCSLVMQKRFAQAPAVRSVNEAAERVIYQLSPLRGEKQADRKYLEYFAEI